MIRLAHLSDIHITATQLDWTLRDWFNKRYAAWFNYRWLGRGKRFALADEVLQRLVEELHQVRPDHIVFSGDATALGFETEIRRAAAMLHVGDATLPPGLAVPGNHDYCTPGAAASGLFERYFAPWQVGQRVGGATYPFAQRVGHVSLIGVNSCTGNFWPWDAGGSVSRDELQRLEQLLASLEPGPRILVTHYPVCIANGKGEHPMRGLRNLTEVLQVAAAGGISLWLHGHRHGAYYFQAPAQAAFPVICAGSATQSHRWSYGQLTIEGLDCRVEQRVFDPTAGQFHPGEAYTLHLVVK